MPGSRSFPSRAPGSRRFPSRTAGSGPIRLPRFLAVTALCFAAYFAFAYFGPHGPARNGHWLPINQHLQLVRSWLGEKSGRHTLGLQPYAELFEGPASVARVDVIVLPPAPGGTEPRAHVGFPLGPAFLLLPLRLLLRGWLATQWLGALIAALAVAAFDAVLPGWLRYARASRALPDAFPSPDRPSAAPARNALVLLAACGTLWAWLAPMGLVWHFAQVVGTGGLTLALLAAWRRRALLAGLAWAFAVTSRPSLALSLPFLLWLLSRPRLRLRLRGSFFRRAALFLLAPAALVVLMLVLNQLRFGSPFEFGYRYMQNAPALEAQLRAHGLFSPAYLAGNVRWLLLQPPVLFRDGSAPVPPWFGSDPMGMGIFFVTPAFLAAFLTLRPALLRRAPVLLAWITLAALTAPALLYYNTGWKQWGGRFLLDAWPFWLLLTALGLERIRPKAAWGLIGLSVASNAWAAIATMMRWWPPR